MHPIYVICGESNTKINEKIESLMQELKDVQYDYISYDAEESSLAILLEEINTIPFLYEHKFVVLKNAIFMEKPDSYDSKLIESFVQYLQKPSTDTTLVIVVKNLKIINNDIRKAIEDNAIIYNIESLKEEDVNSFIVNCFSSAGYKIDKMSIEELIYRTKGNFERVQIEIDKLITYKADTKEVLFNDVSKLVSKDLEDNVFDLVNAVIEGNKVKAISIYDDLVILNEDESKIISLLMSKFNEMYQTKSLMQQGYNKNDIANIFNVKPGRVYYMMKSCENISLNKIKKNINALIDYDYKIKSGQIDKSLALELFLLK